MLFFLIQINEIILYYYYSVGILVVNAIAWFAAGQTIIAVVCIIFALINLVYIYLVRNRIKFASIMLEIVVKVISSFPAMVYYSFASIFVQVIKKIIINK